MRINSKLGLFVAIMVGVLALTSCEKYTKETNEKIETTLDRAEEALQQAQIPDLPEPVDTVRSKNDIWLGNQSVKIMEGDALPSWAEKDDGITISISEEETLPVLVQEITDMTGISVRLDDLKAENAVPTETVPVNYSGKLSGLLNYISNRYGVWWRYRGGTITFFTKETRVFTLYALPTETQMDASISGASMGANGGDGNSSSNLSTSANLALWDSIEKGVEQVVGEDGKLSFSRATGTVTVTASPFVMRRVASYINNWNEKMSRQVAISVKILQVEVNEEDDYGLNLQAIFNNGTVSTGYTSPFLIDAASGSATTGLAGVLSMALIDPNSKWKDSGAIIQALSTQGKTSLVTSSSVTTLNNKIAPVQVSTSENYVKKTNVTTNGSGVDRNTEVDYETDTLNYGFTMEILPRILDHGRLIVLFSLNLTDLVSLETFSSSGTSSNGKNNNNNNPDDDDTDDDTNTGDTTQSVVQLPKMQMRGFMQEVAMRSGSTLVLTGFENVQNQIETAGVGKAKMSILGGKSYSKRKRSVLVILLTPEVLESPLAPETRMRDF